MKGRKIIVAEAREAARLLAEDREREAGDPETRYMLVQDDDCHWYIIPAARRPDWAAWCEIDPEDERAWSVPDWARRVNGPTWRVSFTDPVIGG